MKKCKICDVIIEGTDDTRTVCDNRDCQKRAEYFPFLEPLGSVGIKCPYCEKSITMVIHKER